MTIEEAIAELKEDIALYIPTNGTIEEVDRELPDGRLITALEMGIKALERQKTGKWKCKGMGCYCTDMQGRETWYRSYQCDSCEHIIRAIEGNIETCKYCPNCGARMGVYGDDE